MKKKAIHHLDEPDNRLRYTEDTWLQAKKLFCLGFSFAYIAKKLNMSRTWLGKVAKRDNWKLIRTQPTDTALDTSIKVILNRIICFRRRDIQENDVI